MKSTAYSGGGSSPLSCRTRSGISLFFTLIFMIGSLFTLVSCDCDITLELEAAGSGAEKTLNIKFSGTCGEAFTQLLAAAGGSSGSGTGGASASLGALFDGEEISNQLKASGFSNVAVKADGTKLSVSMKDVGCKSYLFTSGVLSFSDDGMMRGIINPQKLKAFYDSSDSQTQMLLDLFLAPVFNDEQMTVSDYQELIAAVYGEAAGKEIAASKVRISLKPIGSGKAVVQTLALSDVLCGAETNW